MLHIANDADDLAHFFRTRFRGETRLNAFAERVFTREEFLRETLVYDHHRLRMELIALIKEHGKWIDPPVAAVPAFA